MTELKFEVNDKSGAKSQASNDKAEKGHMASVRDGEAFPFSIEALKLLEEVRKNKFANPDDQKKLESIVPAPASSSDSAYPPTERANPATVNGRFADSREKPPADYKGPVFKLSQDYPQQLPAEENLPWMKYDFKTQMPEYMAAVLDYILDGNVEANFAAQKNETRKWFHAPWLHYGVSGREYTHGLTMERNSRPGELSYGQTKQYQNWGIGMYNPRGAYTLGQVWKDPENPNVSNVKFPEGAVSFKLLFTEAPVKDVPYLKGSPELTANIYKESASPMPEDMPKSLRNVRLLQIDVAIKDKRATETGWVLGTFVYDGKMNNPNPWRNVKPVGVAWGNDPDVTRMKAFLGETLKEQTLSRDPELPPQHLGWGGRLNGPVDNPNSSCMSCHSKAEWPQKDVMPPKTYEYDSKDFMKWFSNVKGGESYTPGSNSLDYSLQLSEGLKNYHKWKDDQAKKNASSKP